MSSDEIKLTQQELDEIRDESRFRERTTLLLKSLNKKTEKIEKNQEDFRTDIVVLKAHRGIQWWFIASISFSLIGLAVFVIRVGLTK